MDILPLLHQAFPAEPLVIPGDPGSWASYRARQVLAGHLAGFTSHPGQAAARLLAGFVAGSQVTGLTAPIGNAGTPLLQRLWEAGLVGAGPELAPPETLRHLRLALDQACRALDQPPYNQPPAWRQAPLLAWLQDYTATPLFERAGLRPHWNLLAIIRPGLAGGEPFKLQETVSQLTWALRRYGPHVPPDQLAAPPGPLTARQWLAVFEDLIASQMSPNKPLTRNTLRTYRRDIARLLMDDSLQGWQPRGYGGRRKDYGVEYDQLPEDAPERQAFLDPAAQVDGEIVQAIEDFETGLPDEPEDGPPVVEPEPRPKGAPAPHYADPWPHTLWRSLTYSTQGVPALVEVAFLLQGTSELAAQDPARAERARLVLLAGLLYGWAGELLEARWVEAAPDPARHPGLAFDRSRPWAFVRPQTPVGWPERLVPGKHAPAAYQQAVAEHRQVYEPVEPSYCLALHPALAETVAARAAGQARAKVVLTPAELAQALADLNAGLHRYCPNVPRLTHGRLVLGFHGYGTAYGLDGPAAYLVRGKAMVHQEMPVNYTRLSVADTNRRHWQWADQILADVANQHRYLAQLFGWPALPLVLAQDREPDRDCCGGAYTGSWSVPRGETVRARQCRRADLPANQLENARLRCLAVLAAFLMLMRDFEFNRLELVPGSRRQGDRFTHRAKQKHRDHLTTVHRHIPRVMRDQWWACVAACERDYSGVHCGVCAARPASGCRSTCKPRSTDPWPSWAFRTRRSGLTGCATWAGPSTAAWAFRNCT